jgi:hypothetical protein
MGNITACENLSKLNNACEMHICIKNVNGLLSNSSSPSGTWVIDFADNTKYDDIPISRGFVKWFIDPYIKNLSVMMSQDRIESLEGLNYEIETYSEVIRPLVDNNICPNFIRYLGHGKSCSFDDILRMITGKTTTNPPTDTKLTISEAEENIYRSLLYQLGRADIEDRPSIGDLKEITPEDIGQHGKSIIRQQWKFNLLVNETYKPETLPLSEWLDKYYLENSSFPLELWNIIAQICFGCYAMALSKVTHNDLHHNNIMIEPYDKPTELTYIINGTVYRFTTYFKVLIYDFDRTYAEQLGDNPTLKGLEAYSQTNDFVPNKDIMKISSYIYESISKDVWNEISRDDMLDLLCKTRESKKTLHHILNNGVFLQKKNGQPLTISEYKMFNSIEQILEKVSSFPKMENYDIGNTENRFICNASDFDSKGQIILSKQSIKKAQKKSIIERRQLSEQKSEN